MRIAVASSDGISVDEHFGRAQRFLVYEMGDEGPVLLMERKVPPYSVGDKDHAFDKDRFARVLAALDGCARVYVARIGERPAQELADAGVESVAYTGAIEAIRP